MLVAEFAPTNTFMTLDGYHKTLFSVTTMMILWLFNGSLRELAKLCNYNPLCLLLPLVFSTVMIVSQQNCDFTVACAFEMIHPIQCGLLQEIW